MPRISRVIGSNDQIHLPAKERQEILDVEAVSHRHEGSEIFFRKPKQTDGGKQTLPILRVRRPRKLLLQMHKPARRLNEALEKIRILRIGPQPEMLKDIVRFVITLLIPAAKEADVTRMLCDIVRRAVGWRTAQLFDEPGNSLAFVHGKLTLVSAEMTGNRVGIVFQWRAGACTAAAQG